MIASAVSSISRKGRSAKRTTQRPRAASAASTAAVASSSMSNRRCSVLFTPPSDVATNRTLSGLWGSIEARTRYSSS